jgi:hypothetical protein
LIFPPGQYAHGLPGKLTFKAEHGAQNVPLELCSLAGQSLQPPPSMLYVFSGHATHVPPPTLNLFAGQCTHAPPLTLKALPLSRSQHSQSATGLTTMSPALVAKPLPWRLYAGPHSGPANSAKSLQTPLQVRQASVVQTSLVSCMVHVPAFPHCDGGTYCQKLTHVSPIDAHLSAHVVP